MSSSYKSFSHEAVNRHWNSDLTDWLQKCKGIPVVTSQELKKWDTLLNSGSDMAAISSFSNHTGWKYNG